MVIVLIIEADIYDGCFLFVVVVVVFLFTNRLCEFSIGHDTFPV